MTGVPPLTCGLEPEPVTSGPVKQPAAARADRHYLPPPVVNGRVAVAGSDGPLAGSRTTAEVAGMHGCSVTVSVLKSATGVSLLGDGVRSRGYTVRTRDHKRPTGP